MNIRRKVIPPKLKDFFKFELKYLNLKNNLYYNSQIFNNFTFFCLLVLAGFVMGFIKPIFWVIALSCIALVIFLYLKTLKFCEGVTVTRKTPKFAREKQTIEINYSISNSTAFVLTDLSFMEKFDGNQEGHFKVTPKKILPSHTRINHIQKVTLDAGMGIKKIEPIKITLSDELGIFNFEIVFFNSDEIEVYPHIEETPVLKASISPETIEYGFYEIPKRGDSNLFIGTREYRHGDPIKNINWKLSKKTNKVVVNEYEKNTNTYVTLFIDLDLGSQTGHGELSTWEAAKDLALSITTNEIRKNNLIQVICNNLFIPFGTGNKQLITMEKHFTFHEMINSTGSNHLRYLQDLPYKGQVYFICPLMVTAKTIETFDHLKRLKTLGQTIVIFVLDPFEQITKSIKGEMKVMIRETDRHARGEFLRFEHQFKKMGIPCIYIKVKKDIELYKQVVENAQELIESL